MDYQLHLLAIGALVVHLQPWTVYLVVGYYLLIMAVREYMKGPTKGSDNPKRLDGKVVVLTGGNTGIGEATAHQLSKRGAKVIILCRSVEKANISANKIMVDTRNPVIVKKLDLTSLESVRECAKDLLETEDKIDYLINNAGVVECPQWKTKDGFEMHFGTNHLGHFLLTELLIPHLKKSAATGHDARIVIVSSSGHEMGAKLDFDNLNFERPGSFTPWNAYINSKLANVMHASTLAKRLKGTGITVYSLHPGAVWTDSGRYLKETSVVWYYVTRPLMPIFKTAFYGAQTTLYCTLDDNLKNETGYYYSDCARKDPNPEALIEEKQNKLWEISEKLVGLQK